VCGGPTVVADGDNFEEPSRQKRQAARFLHRHCEEPQATKQSRAALAEHAAQVLLDDVLRHGRA
jgi:hypothetical protein